MSFSETEGKVLGPNMDALDEIKHWQNITLPQEVVETRIRQLLEGLPVLDVYVRDETVKRYENGQGRDITAALKRMREMDMIPKGTAILKEHRDLWDLSYSLGPSYRLKLVNTARPDSFQGQVVGDGVMIGFYVGENPVSGIGNYLSD